MAIRLEYQFSPLQAEELAKVYELPVPEGREPADGSHARRLRYYRTDGASWKALRLSP